jgi:hypothetical protein
MKLIVPDLPFESSMSVGPKVLAHEAAEIALEMTLHLPEEILSRPVPHGRKAFDVMYLDRVWVVEGKFAGDRSLPVCVSTKYSTAILWEGHLRFGALDHFVDIDNCPTGIELWFKTLSCVLSYTVRFGSTAGPRIRFEPRRALKDSLTEILLGLTDPLHQPILAIVRSPSNDVIDILLEITQKTPDLSNWIADEAHRKPVELLLADKELIVNLLKELR